MVQINKNLLKLFDLIGAYETGSKIRPNFWFIPQLGETKISEHTRVEDILEEIYQKGREMGKEVGKKELIKELKKLLEYDNI